MAEIIKKKPPPPRPLKRSSLSGIHTLKTDGGPPFVETQTSRHDQVRHESARKEESPEYAKPDLDEAHDKMSEDSPLRPAPGGSTATEGFAATQQVTSQLADHDSSIGQNGDDSQQPADAYEDGLATEPDDELEDNRYIIRADSDFRDKLMDAVEVILSVDSRLKLVEKKFNLSVSEPETEVDADPDQKSDVDERPATKVDINESPEKEAGIEKEKSSEKRRPCIPQIKVNDWYNFKHKWIGDKKYAIEVLGGPAKYYQDQEKEESKYEKSKIMGNTPVHPQEDAEQEVLTPQAVPERIRINSSPLNAIITELDPLNFPLELNLKLMFRPYRCLVRMEDDLMKYLATLEAKWSLAEREDLERQRQANLCIRGDDQPACKSPDHTTDQVAPCADKQCPPKAETVSPVAADETKPQAPVPSDPLTDSIEALRDLRCLKRFLETYIHPTVNPLRNRTARKIRFPDLWFLFPHGEEVFMPSAHRTEAKPMITQSLALWTPYQSVYRVYDHSGGRELLSRPNDDDDIYEDRRSSSTASRATPFRLMLYHIDWTSKSYWPVSYELEIKPFENERDITSLEVYPTSFHEDFEPVRQQLLERGRKFLKLTTPTHMNYFGGTYKSHPCSLRLGEQEPYSGTPFVESEVMVDFSQVPYNWRPNFRLDECISYPREDAEDWDLKVYKDKEHRQIDTSSEELIFLDYGDRRWLRDHAREKAGFLHDWDLYRAGHEKEPIYNLESNDDIVLLPSRVMGYSFRDRTFNALNIDQLDPVTQGSEGFEGLELPKGHQHLVEALVNEHFNNKEAYKNHGKSTPGMDIVSGKGKGLIMLLHGDPGVGKTSTAECVAQSTGRPLFPITCGDLGLEPREVEDSLNANFRLAAIWNCVMLLDEADIFLAKRDKLDVRRNALVSVFLRVLEYYEGILFLTTNRVGVFDDAFKSRIHVSLCYPPLTKPQTIKIWEKNLSRLRKIEDARAQITEKPRLKISDGEILAYAKEHYKEHEHSRFGLWNGRQIRNAFQTAAALAYHKAGVDGPMLTPNLFKEVAKTTEEFDKYISRVHGGKGEAERAYHSYERIDYATKETGNRNRHTYLGPPPATPVPSPGDRFFANTGPQDMQSKMQDSGYGSQGGMTQIAERATLASSAESSRIFTETARMHDDKYVSPGAKRHPYSPSVSANTRRLSRRDQGQGYDDAMDSEEGEEEESD